MNFLAHAYLSGNNEKILLGNFAGDFIKGRQALASYDPEIVRGVELHRAIDEFTDSHSVVRQSKDHLRPTYRHYAGVIVDVFYDHFLAAHWKAFHPSSLEEFAARTYSILDAFSSELPQSFRRMLPYLIRGNWLVSYRDIAGIHRALSGMASRSPYDSKMEHAAADLEKDYSSFGAEFQLFFPELREFVERWLKR